MLRVTLCIPFHISTLFLMLLQTRQKRNKNPNSNSQPLTEKKQESKSHETLKWA